MDFSKIAFVIGAGAHSPYGFPTGGELKDIILNLNLEASDIGYREVHERVTKSKVLKYKVCKLLFETSHIDNFLNMPRSEEGFEKYFVGEINSFIDRFAHSQTSSIDYFISRKGASEIEKIIGKALIGVIINHFEVNHAIGYKSDWIQSLINNYIRDDYESFFKNPPSIITFNYDRLLEHSLLLHLIHHHGLAPQRASDLIGELRVMHIYGSLDKTYNEKISTFDSGNLTDIDVVRGQNGTQRENEIFDLLVKSTKVYVLGFGYDELNTKLVFDKLSMSGWDGMGHRIVSSSHGLSKIHEQKLRGKFKSTDIYFHKNSISEILGTIEPPEKETSFLINVRRRSWS